MTRFMIQHEEQDKSKKGNERQSEIVLIGLILIVVLMIVGIIWTIIKYKDDVWDNIESLEEFGETDYELIEGY